MTDTDKKDDGKRTLYMTLHCLRHCVAGNALFFIYISVGFGVLILCILIIFTSSFILKMLICCLFYLLPGCVCFTPMSCLFYQSAFSRHQPVYILFSLICCVTARISYSCCPNFLSCIGIVLFLPASCVSVLIYYKL